MSEQQSFWKKIWEVILRFLESLNRTQSSTDKPSNSSEERSQKENSISDVLKGTAKDVATDFLANKASGLISKYGSMIDNLNPKQKEYVIRMAYLKSVDTSVLTLKELLELGDAINQAAALGVEINDELNSFWSEVFSCVEEAAGKFADVGVKVLSKSLIGFLL